MTKYKDVRYGMGGQVTLIGEDLDTIEISFEDLEGIYNYCKKTLKWE